MKIYTKTGDKGQTSLYTGQRVLKNDPLIEAIGIIDECNSAIGAALSFIPSDLEKVKSQLQNIQHALFDIGAAVATPLTRAGSAKIKKTRFDPEAVEQIEHWIDELESHLPTLRQFILPGGHPAGAMLHLSRTICRTAERFLVPLLLSGEISEHVVCYLNRLSDYLFVASRYTNHKLGSPEIFWEPHKECS
jgi:cob(I)alamin adenosyltransferase